MVELPAFVAYAALPVMLVSSGLYVTGVILDNVSTHASVQDQLAT